jgi:hypothetical protein
MKKNKILERTRVPRACYLVRPKDTSRHDWYCVLQADFGQVLYTQCRVIDLPIATIIPQTKPLRVGVKAASRPEL